MEVGFIMPVWYDIGRHRQSDVGFPTLAVGGGSMMSTYEALSLAINFCLLIIARRWLVLFNIKKLHRQCQPTCRSHVFARRKLLQSRFAGDSFIY